MSQTKRHVAGDLRRVGTSGAPLLFESAKRQRFLAYLAHHSPCRLIEALNGIGAGDCDVSIPFAERGLVHRGKWKSAVVLNLNDHFDGGQHLRKLLKELEPLSTFARQPKRRLYVNVDRRRKVDLSDVFGGNGPTRTRLLVALHV